MCRQSVIAKHVRRQQTVLLSSQRHANQTNTPKRRRSAKIEYQTPNTHTPIYTLHRKVFAEGPHGIDTT